MNAILKPIEIVNVENGEPMTTTLQIALGLGIQHATIIKLVRTYMPDFQEFGLVRFKIHISNAELTRSRFKCEQNCSYLPARAVLHAPAHFLS